MNNSTTIKDKNETYKIITVNEDLLDTLLPKSDHKFSKAEAFVYLLKHTTQKTLLNDIADDGALTISTSYRKLAMAWQWNFKTAQSFLETLASNDIIVCKTSEHNSNVEISHGRAVSF